MVTREKFFVKMLLIIVVVDPKRLDDEIKEVIEDMDAGVFPASVGDALTSEDRLRIALCHGSEHFLCFRFSVTVCICYY